MTNISSELGGSINNFRSNKDLNLLSYLHLNSYAINSRKRVQAIIPTLNEENTIGEIIQQTEDYVDDVLIIDGRSYDNTMKIVKENGIKFLTQDGKGKGQALRQAFDNASGDIIIILDADGSMLPKEIPRYLKEIALGADVVKGSRFMPGGGSDDLSFIRKIGNSFFVKLVNVLYGLNLTDICYGYIAFTNHAIEKIKDDLNCDGFDIETEIVIKSAKNGLKIHEVPSFELMRLYGKSNLNALRDGLKILYVILKELF